ncbi:MAG TPA: chemotaxis protein CheB [Candidatus Acidoferrales bacterium]|nr:chemotaxis protein CheB [Candidatus Acidoferrales bacterium]
MVWPDTEGTPPSFPVVCIGGSAGSLAAYVDILRHFPVGAGFAVVIVSHRSTENSGLLLKLLAKATRMEIVEVTDGMLLEAGRIFLSPPHREITTDGLVLKLATGFTGHDGWPTLISDFMLSMANMCTDRAIAIIVSGMGFDGSSALLAIKEAGGWTFAQSDADYMSMPQAAIDTKKIDFILSADEIGERLASLDAHLQ